MRIELSKEEKENTNEFYFAGKYFSTLEEVIEYDKVWKDLALDQETAEQKINTLKNEILMNIFLTGNNFTNSEFVILLNKIFELSMKLLEEK